VSGQRETGSPGVDSGPSNDSGSWRLWLIVCAIAVAFVLYGFFAFFVIGDKGPPDWDTGSVEDVPGASVNSTYPYRDPTVEPDPKHVAERPSKAEVRSKGEADK